MAKNIIDVVMVATIAILAFSLASKPHVINFYYHYNEILNREEPNIGNRYEKLQDDAYDYAEPHTYQVESEGVE